MRPIMAGCYERFGQTLIAKGIADAAKWAEEYRIIGGGSFPGKWTFQHHPWLREIHTSTAEMLIARKAAQMGFTEAAMNKAFYAIDVLKISVMYVLPSSDPGAGDFSKTRFDPALEDSPHLAALFTNVQNVGLKRAGSASLLVRGSHSRDQLKSQPVGLLILDEVDEMTEENIPLALERISGHLNAQAYALSTPTHPDRFIDALYSDSTQEHYMFRCPHCGKLTELTFPECLVITADDYRVDGIRDSYLKCMECNNKLDHETKNEWLSKGQWVAQATAMSARGFYINQLYSFARQPYHLAISYLKGLENPFDETEFYNSKMGLPHIVKGAQIDTEDLKNCRGTHRKESTRKDDSYLTMGIDVGKFLHFEIDSWQLYCRAGDTVNDASIPTIIQEGKVFSFAEIEEIIHRYNINSVVIDMNPEVRATLQLAFAFRGYVHRCYYVEGAPRTLQEKSSEEYIIAADRTSWMDAALNRFHTKSIILPEDISSEYEAHVRVPIRTYRRDKRGQDICRYESGTKADHFAHARTYSEIALAAGMSGYSASLME